MKTKTRLWLFLILWLALGFLLFLSIDCKPKSYPIKLMDTTTFVTYDNNRTEILLICLNLSDRYIFGVVAEITIQHMQTKEIFDCKIKHLGTFGSREMKKFSVWTDKLTFGDDVGVRASFTYSGMK